MLEPMAAGHSGSLTLALGRCSTALRLSTSSIRSRLGAKTGCHAPQLRHARALHSRVVAQSSASASATESLTKPEAVPAAAAPGGNGSAAPARSGAYPFAEIEAKWQAYWEEHKTFRTPPLAELDTSKPKFYALDMFPYPR